MYPNQVVSVHEIVSAQPSRHLEGKVELSKQDKTGKEAGSY